MPIGPGEIATASLFCMMLAMGMGLRPEDFLRLTRRPVAFAFGAAGQLVLLPGAAFAIASGLDLSPTHAIGLVLIAACPGGATSNVFSHYARGDVALSVSLTALSSTLSFLTVPFVVGMALAAFTDGAAALELSFASTASKLFTTTALPVVLGMLCLHLRPALAERVRGPVLALSTAIVVALVIGLGVIIGGSDALRLLRVVPPVGLLIAAMAGVAFAGGALLRLDGRERRTLAIELAIQNFNLAMVVALSILGERAYLGPALVYLPTMLVFAAGLSAYVATRRPRAGAPV